ncbi:sphingoid long-chain bases kinase 1-like [Rutidosis leptorrhynchoides]|uniref:sphingoid long-chain bases kinase 1-like n=1 Tax=Rutidosis leptorrhynchoides TaxID=125765 RepID=UPI003A99D402
MQNSGSLSKSNSLRSPQHSLRLLNFCSQVSTAQQTSPVVFPEKRTKGKVSRRNDVIACSDDVTKTKREEHRIDIGDEHSDLLGYEVISGKLVLDKRKTIKATDAQNSNETAHLDAVDAKLTSRALVWGSHVLSLDDVVSVSYNYGLRHFVVHSYPIKKTAHSLSCFMKSGRSRKDYCFLASTADEASQWVTGFADQHCYVNCSPHPMVPSKKQDSEIFASDFLYTHIKSKSPPRMLVILNPRSGRGRSSKVFHNLVEPIFKLAGFKLEVVKTTSAGHARNLAFSVDFSTCPDGIICVGGDGIVNEVLNGLLCRDNQKEAISIPIGIIPAGSDNSLVWTVLGVRDPVSAALTIVKGGLTATDVFAVEWIQTGVIHFGMTVSYFGFIGDVLELSERYQKRFGPLRYFVAGVLKFLCLPKYSYELEYLPASKQKTETLSDDDIVDMSDLYTDVMKRSDGIPRASSLSSIDSIMTPSRSTTDMDNNNTTSSSTEPSDYVRAIDSKSKRLSTGRNNVTSEAEVIHPSSTPNWPRTRSKSRTDKGWSGLTSSQWGANDKEDISSTMSDPGPIWDAEPKWDKEPNWEMENPIELPGPSPGPRDEVESGERNETGVKMEEKWVVKKGKFLGVLVCNHSCKTVQSLSSQVVAPKAEHDDNTMDLLLVHGSGRLRLIRFFLLLQMGRHLSLPYVEYVKVKSVKLKPGKSTHNGCGIDGELFRVSGQVVSSLLPDQCRLIGRPPSSSVK